MRTSEMLQIFKEEGNILQTTKRRKATWIGHMLHMNCLLKQLTDGKIRGEDGSYGKQRKKT
jgi:hypothetical protein